MFLYAPYNFILKNETDIKLKIFYFSLEMDKESKIIAGISKWIFENYKIIITPNELQSIGKNKLSQEKLELVNKARKYFEQMEDILYISDDHQNPYGIYKMMDQYAKANGTIFTKPITIKDEAGNEKTVESFDYYKANNPKEYVIIMTDHLAELTGEKGLDPKGTIEKHSDNMRILRNRYNHIPVDVQQQTAAQEGIQNFDSSKLEPSLNGLGESKLTQRKANVVLGIFAPQRHEIQSYRGYDITRLKDNYRNLSILKYRNGISNVNTGLYFNGACNFFAELPKSKDMTDKIYDALQNLNT